MTALLSQLLIGTFVIVFSTSVRGQTANPERSATVRLVGGINDREGIVLITYDGQEGKLCDDGFDVKDAAVICRMLGFTGDARVVVDEQGVYGPGATQLTEYILADLDCDGSEPTIADCKKGFWQNTECRRKTDEAAVTCLGERVTTSTTTAKPTSTTTLPPQICEPGELPSDDVRLVGGNAAEGRVEIRLPNNTWRSICDDSWGKADAQVICRMLCYNPAYSLAQIGPDLFGNSTLDIYLDNVECVGNETSIYDCPASTGSHDCDLDEPASVSCLRDAPDPLYVPEPTLECSDDKITAKFDREKEPRLRETHLSLVGADSDCGYTKSSDSNYIIIAIPFAGCNTNKAKTNDTHITYTNTIRHDVPPESSIVSRAMVYSIEVSCIIPRDPNPDLSIDPETRTAPPVDEVGEFRVLMNLFPDSNFRGAIQSFPARITVGNWVYVGVTLSSTDQNLKLIVPECWATPTSDPEEEPKYYFIEQKCRVESSVAFYPLNETMFAFRFQSFQFVGNNQSYVYVHCKSYICNKSEKDKECDRTCNAEDLTRPRDKRSFFSQERSRIYRRSTNRRIFETDRGPLVIVDQINSVPKNRNLLLPGTVTVIPASDSSVFAAGAITLILTVISALSNL